MAVSVAKNWKSFVTNIISFWVLSPLKLIGKLGFVKELFSRLNTSWNVWLKKNTIFQHGCFVRGF